MKAWLEGRREDLQSRWDKVAAFAREGWGPVVVLLGGVVVVALLWRLWTLPDAWFTFDYWGTHHEKIRNLGLVTAAVVGVPLLVWRTLSANTQARIATKGHLTDRFSKAVELLGNDKTSVSVGGIYALEEVAKEDPETYYRMVYEILCTFVRDWAFWTPEKQALADEYKGFPDIDPPALDVQTALTEIGRRQKGDVVINLGSTDLREINFREANLEGAHLNGAWLVGATLLNAKLDGAILMGAHLEEAYLEGASFDGAFLMKAHFQDAYLLHTNLGGVDLGDVIGLTWPQLKSAAILPSDDMLPKKVLEEKRREEAEAEG